ncbi:sugar transferase [Anaerosalibacter sp. Marseille-P3206]|uniref:sugar transferase n=1 Tax=Anaerosalibacter sp. Marseille-P3206 TaxID=1871005 RepID=UPI000986C019|nr:sugar transferase [Anaerosalibacter sp. Marseille-P3206]
MYKHCIKRSLDFTLSLLAIIVLSPIMLLVAILVRINLGSPIIFKQRRPGLNEKIFTVYKFRSMTNEKDESGEFLPVELRITKFGKWLRSTSMDELPQLINILKGDMAIVGPRPLRVEYLELYNDEQRKRHNVRPGLTDLSAIRGRSNVSWEDQFKHDIEYIENLSFLLDLKIVIFTVITVIKREGVSQEGHITREPFRGTN